MNARPDRPAAHALLSRHPFLDTDDPVYATERVSQIFAPHEKRVCDPKAPFRALHRHARLRNLSFNYIRYTPAVTIRSGATRHYYLFLMPQEGRVRVRYGERAVEVAPGQLTVINPLEPIRLDWGDGCAQLVLKVARADLEEHLAARLGRPPEGPVLFDFGGPIDAVRARSFVELVRLVCADLDRARPALVAGAAEAQTEALVLSVLLNDLPHNYSAAVAKPRARPAPYYVKRVEEFIHLHAGRRVTMRDMVALAGVSERSLYKGFRDFRGMGPMAYLKAVRLDRVRGELAAPSGRASVAAAATAWGFHHLGNFARDYRVRFGEYPSATLRSRRG